MHNLVVLDLICVICHNIKTFSWWWC